MITGTISPNREAIIPLQLQLAAGAGQVVDIEAVVDTGFTGSLTLPVGLIGLLGFAFRSRQQIMLGDGSLALADVYVGTVLWEGKPLVAIHADRGGTLRIISARLATSRERRTYEEGDEDSA